MTNDADYDIIYGDFVWRKSKNELNKKKHQIYFEEILGVFADPLLYEFYDVANSLESGEDRYNVIGSLNGIRIVFVSTTDRGGKTRIFSARLATAQERKLYDIHAQEIQDY